MSKYEKLAQEFEELTGVEQWRWAIHHKGDITVYCDSQDTVFSFNDDGTTKIYYFDKDIGYGSGVQDLLEAINGYIPRSTTKRFNPSLRMDLQE